MTYFIILLVKLTYNLKYKDIDFHDYLTLVYSIQKGFYEDLLTVGSSVVTFYVYPEI